LLRDPLLSVIQIRQARLGDDRALSEIDRATWTAVVSPGPLPPAGSPFFNERVRPDDVLVAVVDDRVVGYIQLVRPTTLTPHEHVLQVGGLAVHPHRQRGGIGRRLLERGVGEARDRGARKLALRVLRSNIAARRLYEATGFVVEGVLRDEFLLDGAYVDDVLMATYLAAEPNAVA
jgi:ribosomal protein S18 acetylase RimI-like enzyme